MLPPHSHQPLVLEELTRWWIGMAARLRVEAKAAGFFQRAAGAGGLLVRLEQLGGDLHYILFVLLRYWLPTVLPPPGRERMTKSDPDYWLESEQILKSAVSRLRELKPLIDLLTAGDPFAGSGMTGPAPASPVVEVELAGMLEGIAEVAGSYGGPDYTSVIKNFDPIPLKQTQPFKHNKKNSAELWVVFLLREHLRSLGLGKDRYWPLVAEVLDAADLLQPSGLPDGPDELKAWYQKNWPRTYTQLDQRPGTQHSSAAYQQDFDWFQAWFQWQMAQPGED